MRQEGVKMRQEGAKMRQEGVKTRQHRKAIKQILLYILVIR